MIITFPTANKREVIDITDKIAREVANITGQVNIFAMHSTTAITTANLDPGTDQDLLDLFQILTPQIQWRHPHDPQHAPDHLFASIIGPGLLVPVKSGRLQLGTWQRIVLIEFDGPHERQVEVSVIAGQNADPNFVL
jgi:secondary thiamine-phosphate synthase enzyme